MRLICPNCGAQYAVADDVIPPGGRDVQCSNCAHTWFQQPGDEEEQAKPKPRRARPEPAAGAVAPAPQPPAERRKVDPSVADILREEAARETQKRQTEAPAAPVESQSDLGLAEPPKPKRARPEPVPEEAKQAAQAAAASVGAVTGAAAARASGRERLPDIEEINSSLNSDEEAGDAGSMSPAEVEARERRSFRRTFFLVLLIFAALVAVYVQADAIKAAVPALSGVVDSYVNTVNMGRIWLDDTVRGLTGTGFDDSTN